MKRISTRFSLMMAAAAIVPLLSFGAVSFFSVRSGTQEAVVQGNLSVAQQVGEQIDLYVSSSVKILTALASDLQQTGLTRWQQERILKNYVLSFPEFTELTLLNSGGRPVVTSRLGAPTTDIPGSDATQFGGALLSQFTIDADLLPTSVVAVRVTRGEGGGWLIGRLNLEELWRMVDRIRVGQNGYALVVTHEGRLLAHGDPNAKSQVARGATMTTHPLVTRLGHSDAALPSGASAQYDNGSQSVLGVATYLPDLKWTVIVEQPTDEAFQISMSLQRQLGIAIAAALCAMLALGYLWGRSFINPILKLTRGTRALAAGKLDERVPVESSDELGQLADAFNIMAGRLVELQEDVKKKERQAVFGRVAVGLVHDLSNPIQNIGNSCKMIIKMFDDLEYRESFRRTVERELALVKRFLDDLRDIARPSPLERFPIDVNKALAEVVEAMQTTANSAGVTLATEFVFGPLYIEADLFALNRVYGNLITNAMQATPPRGQIRVRTLRQEGDAVIEFADTGCGIAAERIETIFDDYVTTKRRGLGLGLATSKKVVEQLGGSIAVTSQVGLGSTFTLRFPLTKARPEQLAAV